MPPSICGDIVQSRRGLIALGWSITILLSAIAFGSTLMYMMVTNARYNTFADRATANAYYGNENNENNENEGEGEGEGEGGGEENEENNNNNDDEYYYYPTLVGVKSVGLTFATVYTAALGIALTLFGTTAVVGCMSPLGTFIQPCFSNASGGPSSIRLGLFIGFLFMFSNLTMVCAVIFGEFWVQDYIDGKEKREMPPYAVEITSTAFSGLCLFLSIIYIIFTGMVFVYYDSLVDEEEKTTDSKDMSLGRASGFIHNTTSY